MCEIVCECVSECVGERVSVDVHALALAATTSARWSICSRKVDIRLPGTGNSNSHGARPVFSIHLDDSVDSDQ